MCLGGGSDANGATAAGQEQHRGDDHPSPVAEQTPNPRPYGGLPAIDSVLLQRHNSSTSQTPGPDAERGPTTGVLRNFPERSIRPRGGDRTHTRANPEGDHLAAVRSDQAENGACREM